LCHFVNKKERSSFDAKTLTRRRVFANCDELAQITVALSLSRLPQGHQNHGGEKYAKSLEAGIDLAECHAQQGGCKSGGSDQQRHGKILAFDLGLKNAM
jgi:hypothetical protein